MPNALYTRLQATADRLLKAYGQSGTVTRFVNSGSVYDPVQTTDEYPCTLAVMQIDVSKLDGTLIEASDKMVYVSTVGLSIQITTADKLVIDGKEHAMKIVRPLSPAGLTVLYEIIISA